MGPQKANSGALWKNQRKDNEKQPDWTGQLDVDGKIYWMSAWEKDGRNGLFFSIALRPREEGNRDDRRDDRRDDYRADRRDDHSHDRGRYHSNQNDRRSYQPMRDDRRGYQPARDDRRDNDLNDEIPF